MWDIETGGDRASAVTSLGIGGWGLGIMRGWREDIFLSTPIDTISLFCASEHRKVKLDTYSILRLVI